MQPVQSPVKIPIMSVYTLDNSRPVDTAVNSPVETAQLPVKSIKQIHPTIFTQ